jgi:hypothetical protein
MITAGPLNPLWAFLAGLGFFIVGALVVAGGAIVASITAAIAGLVGSALYAGWVTGMYFLVRFIVYRIMGNGNGNGNGY